MENSMAKYYHRPGKHVAAHAADAFMRPASRRGLETVARFLGHRVWGRYGRPVLVAPDGSRPEDYRSAPKGTVLVYTEIGFGHDA
jgi:hypothetical protein